MTNVKNQITAASTNASTHWEVIVANAISAMNCTGMEKVVKKLAADTSKAKTVP
uniref:Uncharacterized protein n=1 Tax=Romanomermis culicivorax TaxID=13658 RepID=A0A915JPF6_ROMCU